MYESPEPFEHNVDSSDDSSLRPLGRDFTPAATPDRRSSPGQSPEKVTTFGGLSLNDTDKFYQRREEPISRGVSAHFRSLSASQKRPANCDGGVPLPSAKATRYNPAVRSRAKSLLQHKRTNSSPLARQQALKSLGSHSALTALQSPLLVESLRNARLTQDSGYFSGQQSRSNTAQCEPASTQPVQPTPAVVTVQEPVSDRTRYAPPFIGTKPRQLYLGNAGRMQYLPSGQLSSITAPPVSLDQLTSEVRAIYTGLVVVESKCIEIDNAQAQDIARGKSGNQALEQRSPENWRAWTALHKTLLFEHHDFLLSSQHPTASPVLKNLATKYSMPARLWKHGIHAYLEILRHRRPESKEYMPGFIDASYQVIALLYETVPAFEDTWVECLGDLARYRMAVEEEKEIHTHWAGVAAHWYALAAARRPTVGRLNHHMGILERPSIKKFFFYAKSLTCVTPFPNAKDSFNTVCMPLTQDQSLLENAQTSAEASIVACHAMRFVKPDGAMVEYYASVSIRLLAQIPSTRLKEVGAALAIVNISAILELGTTGNPLWDLYNTKPAVVDGTSRQPPLRNTTTPSSAAKLPQQAIHYAQSCMATICEKSAATEPTSRDALPFVHVMLVFIQSLIKLQAKSCEAVSKSIVQPLLGSFGSAWGALSTYINRLNSHVRWISTEALACASNQKFQQQYPKSQIKEDIEQQNKLREERSMTRREIIIEPLEPVLIRKYKPLKEDLMLRGLSWVPDYFPEGWFAGAECDEPAVSETSKTKDMRVERVQGLAAYVAMHSEYLDFDRQTQRFSAAVTAASEQPRTIQVIHDGAKPMELTTTNSPASTVTYSAASDEVDDGFMMVNSEPLSIPTARALPASFPMKQQGFAPISIANEDGGMAWEPLHTHE